MEDDAGDELSQAEGSKQISTKAGGPERNMVLCFRACHQALHTFGRINLSSGVVCGVCVRDFGIDLISK